VTRAVLLPLLIFCASCGRPTPPPAIDPRLAAQVPEDASALAGLNLDALRASPLHTKLAQAFPNVPYILIARRGNDVITILGAGADKPRHTPAPLLTDAAPLAARNPIWVVIRGGSPLPLEGNLANLNNLLRETELVTLGARPGDPIGVDLTAACPTADAAGRFEGSLRALLLLTKLASSVQVRRDGLTVRASLTAPPDLLDRFLR
jgi:hypothetical protein